MSTTSTEPAPTRRGYGSLWHGVPRELGFLLLTMPIAITGFGVVITLFLTGLGLIALVFGVFIVVAALYAARGFGTLEVMRLGWAGRAPIARPVWEPRDRSIGFWRAVFGPFADGHYWLYLLHTVVVAPVISIISWTFAVVWLSIGLGGATFWIWARTLPRDEQNVWLHQVLLDFFVPGRSFTVDPFVGESVVQFLLGVVFLLTLPLITRLFTLLHHVVARGMLSSWRSEALEREVAVLSASRGAAVQAEDRSLRRLERDIHDGPQQRLVRLQMDLAAAERKLDSDPEAARAVLAEARGQAKDTLDELRALSRGFAPPIVQDRGLAAGLESLAAASIIPVRLELSLPDGRLPAEIERNVYFVAAELMTNAAKHSGATEIRLHAALRPVVGGAWLDVWVTDNGRGGASLRDDHGLRGLEERLRGLRGVLVIESPVGGPTVIGAHVPLPVG
ncbi:sensor domain-containing protein [Agromyces atrinae]|uniref:sensor histidine kinase n=1 Tax=Agromyces atrinae TaxID=592376 RepID=UPI001F582B52|nr:sensor domain-containing protein [Agromyces atrinae]MCI2958296.1 sensor domain-containing protein [Agromyces atrinae]